MYRFQKRIVNHSVIRGQVWFQDLEPEYVVRFQDPRAAKDGLRDWQTILVNNCAECVTKVYLFHMMTICIHCCFS